jgi:hypothetical protein
MIDLHLYSYTYDPSVYREERNKAIYERDVLEHQNHSLKEHIEKIEANFEFYKEESGKIIKDSKESAAFHQQAESMAKMKLGELEVSYFNKRDFALLAYLDSPC